MAEFGHVRLSGLPAWLAWAAAHIFFLIDFRSRVLVSAQWALNYVTHQRGSRLIVGRVGTAAAPMLPGGAQPPVAKPG